MAKRLFALLALAAILLACALSLARCLPGSAPVVRWKARQTARSLPAPPEGAVLLAEGERGEGGSVCNVTGIYRVYGTRLPLPEIADYYARELSARGWKPLAQYGPDSAEAVALTLGNDAILSVETEKSLEFDFFTRGIPPEKAAEFPTLYVLHVARTCGMKIGSELKPTAVPGSGGPR